MSRGKMKVSVNLELNGKKESEGKIASLMELQDEIRDTNSMNGFRNEGEVAMNGMSPLDPPILDKPPRYPKSVFFIISNEFCERFSYYGLRAVLVLFFTQKLLWTDDEATEAFHVFSFLCYFTPLLGAIIADSYWGKFTTIFYVSILYAVGNVVLSISSVPKPNISWLAIIGLILIGFGTGGIKPCVSAFGGDQFVAGQEKEQKRFFSLFYFAINAGSLISMFLTPIFRHDVKCNGEDDCFPLAFGVPSALMVVAIVCFIAGKRFYRILPPAEGNIFSQTIKCIGYSIRKKLSRSGPSVYQPNHWLDYASDRYDRQLIEDIKILLRILLLYTPLPVFWALFDQQASRWTLQANKMDGTVVGEWVIKPDQMQVLNSLLVIASVPIFEIVIYPVLGKMGILKKSLHRILVGGLLAAVAFVLAALIQLKIDHSYSVDTQILKNGDNQLNLFNSIPISSTNETGCTILLDLPSQVLSDKTHSHIVLGPEEKFSVVNFTFTEDFSNQLNIQLTAGSNCSNFGHSENVHMSLERGEIWNLNMKMGPDSNFTVETTRESISSGQISIFWQVPQYVVITFSEILFSITGLEFSYSQAPASMKSLIQAAWLLTVSFGNIIDVIVVKLKIFEQQWAEFLFFAGLMAADMILFALLAFRYSRLQRSSPSRSRSTSNDDDEASQ